MRPQVIIFDLDDTLLDTTQLLIPIAKTPAFFNRIQQPLPLMPGALENLEYLKTKYQLGLLTYGNVESQNQKVRSLGIQKYFKHMYFANPINSETKKMYFEKALTDFNLSDPKLLLSIGNRRRTDIRDAKLVGARGCLFRYGEHYDETAEIPEDHPDFEVSEHKNLIPVCGL